MQTHGIEVLSNQECSERFTASNSHAARDMKVGVVMIERPQKPPAETAPTPEALVKIIKAQLRHAPLDPRICHRKRDGRIKSDQVRP